MFYILYIEKPMLSQQASASVGHRGHSLPMSHSFGTELPFRLRIEHSDRRLSKTLFRSTFTLNTQGMTLALNLQVCIFRRPSPSKVLVSTQYGQPQAWFALPIDGNTLVIASKDRCEEGNESFFFTSFIQGKVSRTGEFFHLDLLVYSTGFNISFDILPTRYLI